jgi:membrane-associated phospholipid phosphatase
LSAVPNLGQPTDRLLAAYAALGGAALLFPHRPAEWLWLAVLHVVAIMAGLGLPAMAHGWSAFSARFPGTAARISDLYPLVLIPFLYAELPFLNQSVWDGRYFDEVILRFEQGLFGTQPSRAWAAAMPVLPVSELLHAFYLSYYLIIFLPPIVILASAGRLAFREAVFALMLTFVAHYVFFIYLPVQGPRYIFPAPGGVIADGAIYQLTHALLQAGSSRGAAFPSSHVGVAVAQVIICWRHVPRFAPVIAVMAAGLACGAVYGGFHYAIDAIAGAGLGALTAAAAPRIQRVFHPRH